MKIRLALKPLLLLFVLAGVSLMLVSPAFPFLAQYTKPAQYLALCPQCGGCSFAGR